jgi:hypothetical protein
MSITTDEAVAAALAQVASELDALIQKMQMAFVRDAARAAGSAIMDPRFTKIFDEHHEALVRWGMAALARAETKLRAAAGPYEDAVSLSVH